MVALANSIQWLHIPSCIGVAIIYTLLITCKPVMTSSEDSYWITNVTIVDPIEGTQPSKNVWIRNGRITEITNYEELGDYHSARVIDGEGLYLIPGLWDAHVHYAFDDTMRPAMNALFLAHGVTSVRDTGGPLELVTQVRIRTLEQPMKAPNVYIAGPLIDGSPNVYNDSSPSYPLLSVENSSSTSIQYNTQLLIDNKVDFLKAYEMLSQEQYLELMRLAREEGLLVTGHIPLSMDLFSAVEAGLNGIEHLRNIEMSIATNSKELLIERLSILENPDSLNGAELRSSLHAKQRMDAIQMIDSTLLVKAAELLAKNSVWQTPTLALYNNFATREFLTENQLAELKKLPTSLAEQWRMSMEPMRNMDINPNADIAVYNRWMKEMVRYLHANNVPFMAGTDTPIGYLIPGQSLHKELELLVESGFSNEHALRAATINPATFLGVEEETGQIKVGYNADLVLLKGNPLQNISFTQQIHAVIKNGTFWSVSELDSMLIR